MSYMNDMSYMSFISGHWIIFSLSSFGLITGVFLYFLRGYTGKDFIYFLIGSTAIAISAVALLVAISVNALYDGRWVDSIDSNKTPAPFSHIATKEDSSSGAAFSKDSLKLDGQTIGGLFALILTLPITLAAAFVSIRLTRHADQTAQRALQIEENRYLKELIENTDQSQGGGFRLDALADQHEINAISKKITAEIEQGIKNGIDINGRAFDLANYTSTEECKIKEIAKKVYGRLKNIQSDSNKSEAEEAVSQHTKYSDKETKEFFSFAKSEVDIVKDIKSCLIADDKSKKTIEFLHFALLGGEDRLLMLILSFAKEGCEQSLIDALTQLEQHNNESNIISEIYKWSHAESIATNIKLVPNSPLKLDKSLVQHETNERFLQLCSRFKALRHSSNSKAPQNKAHQSHTPLFNLTEIIRGYYSDVTDKVEDFKLPDPHIWLKGLTPTGRLDKNFSTFDTYYKESVIFACMQLSLFADKVWDHESKEAKESYRNAVSNIFSVLISENEKEDEPQLKRGVTYDSRINADDLARLIKHNIITRSQFVEIIHNKSRIQEFFNSDIAGSTDFEGILASAEKDWLLGSENNWEKLHPNAFKDEIIKNELNKTHKSIRLIIHILLNEYKDFFWISDADTKDLSQLHEYNESKIRLEHALKSWRVYSFREEITAENVKGFAKEMGFDKSLVSDKLKEKLDAFKLSPAIYSGLKTFQSE